jgi:hypothetical protein
METCVECTHCRVVMTSWSAQGSRIRYYQCPFCQRTHSSLYGEVFARRAGARVLEARPGAPPAAAGIPMPSQEDVRWANVKATAARWFARLEADERRCTVDEPPTRARRAEPDAPDADPADVVELAAVGRRAG